MNIFKDARMIYKSLQDDISKRLFEARLLLSATGNSEHITNLPMQYRNLSADIEMFYNNLHQQNKYERTVVFKNGNNGQSLVQNYRSLKVFAFIDNYCKNKTDDQTGLPVFKLNEYINHYGAKGTRFVISVAQRNFMNEMNLQLLSNGIEEKDIVLAIADWRNNTSQYFDLFVPEPNEAFVDCGCFDGSTAFHFAGWCGSLGYNKIWSFEPDLSSYKKCKAILSGLSNCEVYPYGISDRSKTVPFLSNGNEDARIVVKQDSQANLPTIEVISLDEFLKNEKISFIKMDIEGAEYDALLGASHIIKDQKPRLAISIYHNSYHIITIPKLLLNFRPDYKLWIRHYSLLPNETILYAE